jgi:hypothetical protein
MNLLGLPPEMLIFICEILYDIDYLNFVQQTCSLIRAITNEIEVKKGKKYPPITYYIQNHNLIEFALYKTRINFLILFEKYYMQANAIKLSPVKNDYIIDCFVEYIGRHRTYSDFKEFNYIIDKYYINSDIPRYEYNERLLLINAGKTAKVSNNQGFLTEMKRLHFNLYKKI